MFPVSELRSVLEELTGFDPSGLSVAELAGEITEALHGIQTSLMAFGEADDFYHGIGHELGVGFVHPMGRLDDPPYAGIPTLDP